MTQPPPLNDEIVFAVAKLVDDAQTDTREPSHSDIEFCITKCHLSAGDPKTHGQTVGKAKRVRACLSWAIEHAPENGRRFVAQLTSMVRSRGGFREHSPNFVGGEAIESVRGALNSEGFTLTSDGELQPRSLESLSGAELTRALESYVQRAQRGAGDAALVVGTGKDLLEAVAAHVLTEVWGQYSSQSNFPMLLGQAFVALDLKTTADPSQNGEPPQHRLQRALYDAACAVNTLRNKQGSGHGRPWLPTVSVVEARHAIQVMGVVGELLLQALKQKKYP